MAIGGIAFFRCNATRRYFLAVGGNACFGGIDFAGGAVKPKLTVLFPWQRFSLRWLNQKPAVNPWYTGAAHQGGKLFRGGDERHAAVKSSKTKTRP